MSKHSWSVVMYLKTSAYACLVPIATVYASVPLSSSEKTLFQLWDINNAIKVSGNRCPKSKITAIDQYLPRTGCERQNLRHLYCMLCPSLKLNYNQIVFNLMLIGLIHNYWWIYYAKKEVEMFCKIIILYCMFLQIKSYACM